MKNLSKGDERLKEMVSSPQTSIVNFCSAITWPFVVALKHKIVEAKGFKAVNVNYFKSSLTVKSDTLLTPEQSEPVDKEYVKGWKHSASEFVESSMNQESIGMVYGSPF